MFLVITKDISDRGSIDRDKEEKVSPFVEFDDAIMICVDGVKECAENFWMDHNARLLECRLYFLILEFTVPRSIDFIEQSSQFPFRFDNERLKLMILPIILESKKSKLYLNYTIMIEIGRTHHVIEE